MARRRFPVATVKLHQPGRRYTLEKPAWSFYDHAGSLWRHGRLTVATAAAGDLGVVDQEPGRELPLAYLLDELNAVFCAPFWPLDVPSAGEPDGWWNASAGLTVEVDNLPETAFRGVAIDGPGQISSRFTIGRDCWWHLVFWREKTEDDEGYGQQSLGSEIIWGYDGTQGWGLAWPRGSRPKLAYFADGTWHEAEWTSGTGPQQQNHSEGQLIVITVGVLRGRIVIIDWLGGRVSTFQRTAATWETAVEGDIALRNFTGQWFVQFMPAVMFEAELQGVVTAPREQTDSDTYGFYLGGYSTGPDGPADPYGSVPWSEGEPVWGLVPAGSLGIALRAQPPYAVEWRVRMKPYAHESSFDGGTMTTYATPAFCALGIWQDAVLQDNGEPAVQRDLTADGLVEELEADLPGHHAATQVILRLNNRSGQAKDIGDFQQVTIERVGWIRKGAAGDQEDVVQEFEKLLTLEPSLEGAEAEVPLLDLLAYLGTQRFDQGLPRMDGWNVRDAIAWILEAYGIGPEQYDLEDTGAILTVGDYEKPLWQPERGRRVLDFLRELVEKGSRHGAIWCENGIIRTGCRFCRTKRTVEDWLSHCDNGWASSGCLAADVARSGNSDGVDVELYARPLTEGFDPDEVGVVVALHRYTARVDSQDYANYVSVQGKTPEGETLAAVVYDSTDELYQRGWLVPRIETDASLSTPAAVNARAQELLNELSEKAIFVRGTVLWDPRIRPGRVVRIHGAERLGLDGHKFRVVSVSHSIRRDRPYTTFVGRQIS